MISTICICGAGTMGGGIAQVAAQSGFSTILFDVNSTVLAKAKTAIEGSLQYLVEKQKITTDEKQTIFQRINFTGKIDNCVADVIIEAIIEDLDAKAALFNQLAAINKSTTIFASNTSSLSITAIQEKIANPERVAGMHFFNPAYIMKLVEVVEGKRTSAETINTLYDLCVRIRKTPVKCKDAPGFIVNRVARPYYLEAMRLVEQGVADIETVDKIMEASGFKMGPFKLMDLIGIDINYSVSDIVWEALGKPERLRPSPLQKEKVESGKLGKKTGEGFYTYGQE